MLELELENCQSGAKGLKTKVFPDEQLINLAFLLVSSCGMKVKKLEIVEACVSAKEDYQFCEVQLTKDLSVLVQVVTDDLFTFVIDKLNKDGVFGRRVGISSLSFFDLDNVKFLPFKIRKN